MTLKRTTVKSNVEFQNLPEGDYDGRLVYIADLGLQERSYKGEEKDPAYYASLGIEILGQPISTEDGTMTRIMWTKPFPLINKKISEKSGEFKAYKVFDKSAQDNCTPDWEAQLGKPVSVSIVHVPDKADPDIVYDNISMLTPIPDKYAAEVPEAETEFAVGDSDTPDNVVNGKLYGLAKWMFDKRLSVPF